MAESDPNPTTVIVGEILRRLNAPQFVPFAIMLSDGSKHPVPTPDHCTVTRLLRRVQIEYDNYRIVEINPLHVTRLEAMNRPAA